MIIIFGIISALAVILEEYLASMCIGYSVLGFSLFRYIPVGALLIGMFIGGVMVKGLKVSNKKMKKIHGVLAMLIAAITFFGIGFMEYKTTYISYEYIINSKQIGQPISTFNYTDDNGNEVKMSFVNYTKYILDNSKSMVITKKHGQSTEINTSARENYIRYFSNLIAIVIVALLWMLIKSGEEAYCNSCNVFNDAGFSYICR